MHRTHNHGILRKVFGLLLVFLLSVFVLTACSDGAQDGDGEINGGTSAENSVTVQEDGSYDSAVTVAIYLRTYDKLPSNYITKKEARKLGWEGGSVEKYAEGKCIGGDRFGNYEGILPKKSGLTYYECDIDTLGKSSRGAKRIIYDTDGNIYYTEDHYETFTKMEETE